MYLGEDLETGHREGGSDPGGPVAVRHGEGDLPQLEQGEPSLVNSKICREEPSHRSLAELNVHFKADPGLLVIGGESGTIVTIWDLVSTHTHHIIIMCLVTVTPGE